MLNSLMTASNLLPTHGHINNEVCGSSLHNIGRSSGGGGVY